MISIVEPNMNHKLYSGQDKMCSFSARVSFADAQKCITVIFDEICIFITGSYVTFSFRVEELIMRKMIPSFE